MTIDSATLAAFVDGELSVIEAARVERAIAADPMLAAQVTAHRRLRETLADRYAPVAAQPVPDRLSALLKSSDPVVNLADARAARDMRTQRFRLPIWATGGAMAASLVVGLGIGTQLPDDSVIGTRNGNLVAQNTLDRALTTQLAAAQKNAPIQMLVSFRERGGSLCRGFDGAGVAGIACRDGDAWIIRRAQASEAQTSADYRQASSAASEILAMAQDISAGTALDEAQEKAARDSGWRQR